MTSSETTEATAVPSAPDFRVMYRSGQMTHMQAFAAIYGQREGMIRNDDLPAGPAEDDPDGCRWRRDVQAVLERTGTIAAYRRSLLTDAYAADCPSWCLGKHPTISAWADVIRHEIVLARVTFDGADTINRGVTVELCLSAFQDDEETGPATLYVRDAPEILSPSDAAELGQAIVNATATLRHLVGDTPTVPDPAGQVMAEQAAVAEDVQ